MGKNINLKYKELVEKFEKTEPLKINEFYCINFNNTNLNIFDEPSKSHDLGNYLHVELASQCTDNSMFITIVTQNDIIDHSKKNPFIPNYQITTKGKLISLLYKKIIFMNSIEYYKRNINIF